MHPPAVRVLTWIFSWLVPKDVREPLIGDLLQGYVQRVQAGGSSAALMWYLRQILASIPSLLWTRLRRAVWLSTLAVAVLAYFTVGFAQLLVRWAVLPVNNRLDVIAIFPVVVVIGYFAERLRRRSALVLGAMMLIAITLMTLWGTDTSPLWYRTAWFVVGPLAAFIGGRLPALRRAP
jgi:hypothetical protein